MVQLWAVASLIGGQDTLYLRDVLNTHLAGEISMASGSPLRPEILDLARGGGQPATGNPNFLPFYPTRLLYEIAPPIWALNAHFWIHFLLMPWCFFFLSRTWGLSREASWAAATVYAFSGFALSHMSFYNLIPIVAWCPLLVASWVRLGRRPSHRDLWLAGLSWALILLSGDPMMAGLGSLAALLAVAVDYNKEDGFWDLQRFQRLVVPVVAGGLIAAPQIVEFLRVLPTSFRAQNGFIAKAGVGSFDFPHLFEWLLPGFFGRIDRLNSEAFWGHAMFGDALPLFLTLTPGWLAMLLWCAGPKRSRSTLWAGACIVIGLLVSLEGFGLPTPEGLDLGSGLFRFRVKAWILFSLGMALWAGGGFERAILNREAEPRRRSFLALGGLLVLNATGLFVFARSLSLAGGGPVARWVGLSGPLGEYQVSRWFQLASVVLGFLAVVGCLLALSGLRPREAGALLLLVHAVGQVGFLGFSIARDRTEHYLGSESIPWPEPGARVVHAQLSSFPEWRVTVAPDAEAGAHSLFRGAAAALYPFVGVGRGLQYELNPSPEGLDSYLTYLATDAASKVSIAERVRLLRAWGVETMISRPGLRVTGLSVDWERVQGGERVAIYTIEDPVPAVRLVGGVRYVTDPLAAVRELLDPGFDPLGEVVLAGVGDQVKPGRQVLDSLEISSEELTAVLSSTAETFLVVDRTYQPVYRAAVDGQRVPIEIANLHRMAIRVPSGATEVRLWVDRSPLRWAVLVALAGCLLLWGVGRRVAARAGQSQCYDPSPDDATHSFF